MPRGQKINRSLLFREIKKALDEVDNVKRELRKAKARVSVLLDKLNLHAASSRARRKKGTTPA